MLSILRAGPERSTKQSAFCAADREGPVSLLGPVGGPLSVCQSRLGVLSGDFHLSCSHAHELF